MVQTKPSISHYGRDACITEIIAAFGGGGRASAVNPSSPIKRSIRDSTARIGKFQVVPLLGTRPPTWTSLSEHVIDVD